jgi:regulation of enolase protein 1 (concanavalin A-like superfamily)
MPQNVSVRVSLDYKYWQCACWLMTDTQNIVQTGVVVQSPQESSSTGRSNVTSKPGEIVFEARATTFFERLLYPLTKE